MGNCATLDCGLLDPILGSGKPRFSGSLPVCKKIPGFFLFFALWLVVLIFMSKALQLPSFNPLIFTLSSSNSGYWEGTRGVNWIPDSNPTNVGLYGRFGDTTVECPRACNNLATCKAYLVSAGDEYSSYFDTCSLWEGEIFAFKDPSYAKTCRFGCRTYVKSTGNPFNNSDAYSAPYTSALAPGNQRCSNPLYYGIHLGIILISVACLVYWVFFTLTVPSGRLLRLLFFLTCVGLIVAGAFTVSWAAKDVCCTRSLYSTTSTCEPNQKALRDSAIAVGAVMLAMGAFPVLCLPWFLFHFIVWGILAGLYSLIMGADFTRIWSYSASAEWLIWQKNEVSRSQNDARASGPPVNVSHPSNPANEHGNQSFVWKNAASIQMKNMDPSPLAQLAFLREQLANEQITNSALRQEIAELRGVGPGVGSDDVAAQLRQEQRISADLRLDLAQLRQEIAILQLSAKPSPVFNASAPHAADPYAPQPAPYGGDVYAPPSYDYGSGSYGDHSAYGQPKPGGFPC